MLLSLNLYVKLADSGKNINFNLSLNINRNVLNL